MGGTVVPVVVPTHDYVAAGWRMAVVAEIAALDSPNVSRPSCNIQHLDPRTEDRRTPKFLLRDVANPVVCPR